MFAYCENEPVLYTDPTGHAFWGSNTVAIKDAYGGGCAGTGGSTGTLPAVTPVAIQEIITDIFDSIMLMTSYRAYAQASKVSNPEMTIGNYPRIHHIVPHGDFSNRNVAGLLEEAHAIMKNAGVNPFSDNNNQIVVSNFYHSTLHTDDYIRMVTEPIIALGEYATRDQVYEVLFYLRINIAACDPQAYGY